MLVKRILSVLLLMLFIVTPILSIAQCSMCRAAAEGSDYAKSLNTGILYLLLAPFFFIITLIIVWIKNKDKFSSHEY